MRMFDGFSRTQSVSKAFRKKGWETITLEIDENFPATFNIDILDWDYKNHFLPRDFEYMHFSPPCDRFTKMQMGNYWKINKVTGKPEPDHPDVYNRMELVNRSVEIINYFKPDYYTIENPIGMIKHCRSLRNMKYHQISYCQYELHKPVQERRMKPTWLIGKLPYSFPVRTCKNNAPCHPKAPRGSDNTGTQALENSIERAKLPDGLCDLLAEHITASILDQPIGDGWFLPGPVPLSPEKEGEDLA